MLVVDKRKGDTMPQHEIIKTPSLGLNRALGGGLYTGATHLFWGTPSVGKVHCDPISGLIIRECASHSRS